MEGKDENGKFTKGHTFGNRFQKGESGNPKGRPPSIITKLKDLIGGEIKASMSINDYRKVCGWLMERNQKELQKISRSSDTPVFLIVLISSFLKDIKKGSMYTFEKMIEKFVEEKEDKIAGERNILFVSGFELDPEKEEEVGEDDKSE